MNIYEVIRNRRSVRAYLEKPVSEEALERILEAARLAPSGSNRQARKFVVVTSGETREKIARAAKQDFLAGAPVIIAGVGTTPDRTMSCGIQGDPVDVAIAMDHISLAAVEEGLGTCWIGAFPQEAIREILHIPGTSRVIELMALGYPADTPRQKVRKSLEEIVCRERFS